MDVDLDSDGYANFGDVARGSLGMQCQYASQYVTGTFNDRPNLGQGLRFKNLDTGNYHEIRIHGEDIGELVSRFQQMRAEQRGEQPLWKPK